MTLCIGIMIKNKVGGKGNKCKKKKIFDRYVDDELEGLAAIEPGVRFEGGKLVMDENQVEEDKELAADERTFRLLKDIGNSIFD